MRERTGSGFPDMTMNIGPIDTSTSLLLPTPVFLGTVRQVCHELFRARILHPLAARWEVLSKLFLLR
jgi:hypothetical protein